MSAMENHWGKAMGRFESIPKPPSPRLISDGFGFSWPFGRKRRARLAESKARQRQLADFWKAEQIRLNPNMAYLLSGASFEKEKFIHADIQMQKVPKWLSRSEKRDLYKWFLKGGKYENIVYK